MLLLLPQGFRNWGLLPLRRKPRGHGSCFYLGSRSLPMGFLVKGGSRASPSDGKWHRNDLSLNSKCKSADTGFTFPHPQVVVRGRPFKKLDIMSMVYIKWWPHSSTQRAGPLFAKSQTENSIDLTLSLVAGCRLPLTVDS